MLSLWTKRKSISQCIPLVFEPALAGDKVVVEIIVRQGKGLAEFICFLAHRFDKAGLEFVVFLAGSVFKGVGPLLADTLIAEIHRSVLFANNVRTRFEPAMGSLQLAYNCLGIQTDEVILGRVAYSAPKHFF